MHELNPGNRFSRTKKHSRRETVTLCDEIQTVIHAVDEIDVGDAGFAIHQAIPFGRAAGSVAGRVLFADVCLDFGNPRDQSPPFGLMDNVLAD